MVAAFGLGVAGTDVNTQGSEHNQLNYAEAGLNRPQTGLGFGVNGFGTVFTAK